MARPSKRQLAARVKERAAERRETRLFRWQRDLEKEASVDAVLARCDGCGLEQVASPECPPCVVCGGTTGAYVGPLMPIAAGLD